MCPVQLTWNYIYILRNMYCILFHTKLESFRREYQIWTAWGPNSVNKKEQKKSHYATTNYIKELNSVTVSLWRCVCAICDTCAAWRSSTDSTLYKDSSSDATCYRIYPKCMLTRLILRTSGIPTRVNVWVCICVYMCAWNCLHNMRHALLSWEVESSQNTQRVQRIIRAVPSNIKCAPDSRVWN